MATSSMSNAWRRLFRKFCRGNLILAAANPEAGVRSQAEADQGGTLGGGRRDPLRGKIPGEVEIRFGSSTE